MSIIENEIASFVTRKVTQSQNGMNNEKPCINLYYRNQMSSQYKQEERNLRKIVDNHLTPKPNSILKLSIYYKNKKLSNLLIKNNIHNDSSNSHVVYKYNCEECQPSPYYIGYTTTTLKQRSLAHTQNGSIKSHNLDIHNKKIKTADVLPNMKVIHRSTARIELQIAEALFIKQENPPLNNKNECDTRI